MALKDGATSPRAIAWSPDALIHEPPEPPATDVRVEEEAAAQAAAQAAGYEGRRARKFLQRRTVDYFGTEIRYQLVRGVVIRPSAKMA